MLSQSLSDPHLKWQCHLRFTHDVSEFAANSADNSLPFEFFMKYAVEECVHGLNDLDETLRQAWEAIARQTQANPSLYPAWTSITAESHDLMNDTKLFVARRDGGIVGVFPVYVKTSVFLGIPFRTLSLVSNVVSYHNNLLSTLGTKRAIKLIIDRALSVNTHAIHLAGIPDESELGAFLLDNVLTREYRTLRLRGESSPYLPLTENWDELLASKPKKFRYKLRKRAELLANSKSLRMRWFNDSNEFSALIDAICIIENNSWKKDAGLSIFDKSRERRYNESLISHLIAKNALLANVLYHDETPIAYNLCCILNGWVGQMKTSFDTQFSDLSPGALVIDHAIRRSFELSAYEFDFLGDADQHKLAWTKQVRSHSDHFLFLRPSLRGNLIGTIKQLINRVNN